MYFVFCGATKTKFNKTPDVTKSGVLTKSSLRTRASGATSAGSSGVAIQSILTHMKEKHPCVYILTNHRNGTLYTGVTSNLPQRLAQHQNNTVDGFTKQYNTHTLVYFEQCETMETAIAREKQIKAGSRRKKLEIIEQNNPLWRDLTSEI